MLAAGGTGGHLYPAIALARAFLHQAQDADILFVGTPRGIERRVLAHEGLPFQHITARPFMGKQFGPAVLAIAALPLGVWQSIVLLRRHQTTLVIGVGGYTSPPVLLAACLMKIPRVILEPNAYPGMANQALAPFVDRVFVGIHAAAASFPSRKVRVVGVPLRSDFLQDDTSRPDDSPPVLLIVGGSQGASAINTGMIEALPHLASYKGRVEVVHQTGEADWAWVQAAYRKAEFPAEVVPFLFDMPRRLRAATLVVGRAGAMTLAEITVCGKPSILIPFPHAIYDHQTRNARVLEANGAAVLIPQAQLTGGRLAEVIGAYLNNPDGLAEMGQRSRELGRADAAERIVQECNTVMRLAER